MSWWAFSLRVDRESTSMGDDMTSHTRDAVVARGAWLSEVIEQHSPEIRSKGWSWVVDIVDPTTDFEVSAVWSIDYGVQLLVPDRRMWRGPARVFFRYFASMDPAWLHQQLAGGAPTVRGPAIEERWRAEQAHRRSA